MFCSITLNTTLLNPFAILRIWDGGMAFSWGFYRCYSRRNFILLGKQIALWPTADPNSGSTPPGLFFGRVANFINAELWGRPTEVYWGRYISRRNGTAMRGCNRDFVLGIHLSFTRLDWRGLLLLFVLFFCSAERWV